MKLVRGTASLFTYITALNIFSICLYEAHTQEDHMKAGVLKALSIYTKIDDSKRTLLFKLKEEL